MDFLKEILGDELFEQFTEKINAYNGNEANKDKQVKIGNLASGEYVGKGKFDALNELLIGKKSELETANGLIEELKKSTKGDENLQGKIGDYERTVAELQEKLQEARINSAVKLALLSEKAVDVDYLTYKLNESLKEKGEVLELDENDKIKGWKDMLSGLKTQFPAMFEKTGSDGYKVFGDNRLPKNDDGETIPTKEQFAQMSYEERVALKKSNEQAYRQLAKK